MDFQSLQDQIDKLKKKSCCGIKLVILTGVDPNPLRCNTIQVATDGAIYLIDGEGNQYELVPTGGR